jgi:hypothetical protein
MRSTLRNGAGFRSRFAILILTIAILQSVPALCQTQSATLDLVAQTQTADAQPVETHSERFWLAGRYDGNRIIVYFDAVKFNGTVPSIAEKLTDPVVAGFFMPVKLPWAYVAKLQQKPGAEQFKLGDRYDLVLSCDEVAPVTLTTMLGTEGDEPVGNDSYIGALATIDNDRDRMIFKGYYAVRRHRDIPEDESKRLRTPGVCAGLEDEPVRFDFQSQIVDLLTQRMKTTASEAEQSAAHGISPIFNVQEFRLADGTLRYYARAAWKSGNADEVKSIFALAAWIAPEPTLHALAVQTRTSPYDGLDSVLPNLLNVVDLSEGRTGIIVAIIGEDEASTRLLEYRDGLDFQHMRVIQYIGAGE